ncbi:MAG: hypothetical protein AVO35_11110 [Candidatus Aegiribacteria sp. MLS_C]|nr:MAG: hypothetical protein AVO35_11110 [Candidatus Aegiribacteria sp. MLS_C]
MVTLGRDLGKALGTLVGGGLSGSGKNPLGSLLDGLGGGDQDRESDMLKSVLELVKGSGGLGGLLALFDRSGLAEKAQSWVSSGPNEEIEPNEVRGVFGDSAIGRIASQLGLGTGETSSLLAKILPEVVNQVTPKGETSGEQDDLISRGLSLLGGPGGF